MKFMLLVLQNVRRNKLRTTLTCLGTMVLVVVVTLVWSVLTNLQAQLDQDKSKMKAIVTERWRIPSQMPYAYARGLSEGAARKEGDIRPEDSMSWSFYGGSTDPEKRTRESMLFAIAMEPRKMTTMLDELDDLPDSQAQELKRVADAMEKNVQAIIVGKDRLAALKRRVGDRFKLTSINYKGIDLEFEILGVFPPGRYDQSAIMNIEYLNRSLEKYERETGRKHVQADRSMNLFWLVVPDTAAFNKISGQIMESPDYKAPAVRVETLAAGVATFMEPLKDILWGMRWLLAPAVLATLSLVIANAISISVRERYTEFAVLKVLGYKPWQILTIVLCEALIIGTLSGLLSAALTWLVVNHVVGGLPVQLGFFGKFYVPAAAFWWGTAVGAGTALVGSLLPAWTACRVRVAQVFARVA
ncbi:MAG: ABC transporter permease [Planctomycetia bacterium]|nr:ABC transporter permease [Planctomycetia bacterium]